MGIAIFIQKNINICEFFVWNYSFFCIFTVYTETNYSFQDSRRRLNDEQIRNILEDITIGDFHQEEEQDLVEGDDSFSEENENPEKSDRVPKWNVWMVV